MFGHAVPDQFLGQVVFHQRDLEVALLRDFVVMQGIARLLQEFASSFAVAVGFNQPVKHFSHFVMVFA